MNLPPGVRDAIHAETRALRDACRSVKWVDAALLHFTVKFLGERPDDVVPRIAEAVGPVARAHRPFDLALAGVGAFPNLRAPRVVWLGVRDDRPFVALARAVDEACTRLGAEAERRAPRAHLTLGRVKQPLAAADAAALERGATSVRAEHRVRVGTLDLMHSALSREGSRYTVLTRLPLGAAQSDEGER